MPDDQKIGAPAVKVTRAMVEAAAGRLKNWVNGVRKTRSAP